MEVKDDHERFTRLLIQHEPELLRCALVAVPNRTDVRDILQECSVALWRCFSEYDPKRSFVNWVLGFVRMEVRRFLRKSTRRAQLTARAAELLLQDQHQYYAPASPQTPPPRATDAPSRGIEGPISKH
jgi:RNA polymerase sigma factor (sigma-70 family)